MLQPWLVVLLLVATLGAGVLAIGLNQDDLSKATVGIIVYSVFLVLLWTLLLTSRLQTYIYANGVSYRFRPFHRKRYFISWDDVERCYVRKYKPFAEYGGWGLRMGTKAGMHIPPGAIWAFSWS